LTVAIRIRDYSQLRVAISARRRQLGLRQLEADEKAGLQPGYVGKLECGDRHLGPLSLPMLLAALDCDLYLAPRSDAAPVIEQRQGSAGRVDHHHLALPNPMEDQS
jgi:transcriptional regulator with XRE-family HTH domain